MDYLKRVLDKQFDLRMEAMGATLIVGPKGCGKTTTAKQKAKTIVEFQDEELRENYLLTAQNRPSQLGISNFFRVLFLSGQSVGFFQRVYSVGFFRRVCKCN